MQVKVTEEPTIPVWLERESDADVIKLLGTEGKPSTEIMINVYKFWYQEKQSMKFTCYATKQQISQKHVHLTTHIALSAK